jgi:hypothetical protein
MYMYIYIHPMRRHSLVPPPLCAARAALPAPPSAVALSSAVGGGASGGERGDERVAAVLSDGRLALLRCVEEDLWEETLQVCVW